MVGLLRHLYDLPYNDSSKLDDNERWDSLVPHAEVFVVAEKYQMACLQNEVCSNMSTRIDENLQMGQFPNNMNDFLRALRKIAFHTSDNSSARRLMVHICVMHLRKLQQEPDFISLLQECGRLGADIIGHNDLECGISGAWICSKGCPDDDPPSCSTCARPFEVDQVWGSRHSELWWCDHCEEGKRPICKICDETFEWTEGRMVC